MNKKRERDRPDGDREDAEPSETVGSDFRALIADATEPLRESLEKPVAHVTGFVKWARSLRPYRVFRNYSLSDGNLRAAGIAFQSVFAVFAALWVGFSIAGIWLRSAPEVYDALITLINRSVPNLIETSGTTGIITSRQLEEASGLGWGSIIAAVGLVWTAIAWLFYTRQAIRAIFGLSRDTTNYVWQKISDFGFGIAFGLLLLLSAVVTIASTQALAFLLDLMGVSSHSVWAFALTRAVGLVVSVMVNLVTLGLMFRVMARVRIPIRNLAVGALLGACTLAVLSIAGGALLGGASKNPLLATFGVFIGLLLWFNLVSRVILLSASWIAVGMTDQGISARWVTPEQKAAEEAAAEYEARVLLAQTALDDARTELAEASFIRTFSAQRRVVRSERALNDLLDEGRPQTTKMRR